MIMNPHKLAEITELLDDLFSCTNHSYAAYAAQRYYNVKQGATATT